MILIVEDEKKLAHLLRDYLSQSQFDSHCLHNGSDVMPWLEQHQADAVLLDLMLPGKDGITLCKEIRAISTIPIIMVTAKAEEVDRLLGLELGADDYICKPYSPREVVARVKAVLRRCQNINPPETGMRLDDDRLCLYVEGKPIVFTAVEYQLVKQLAGKPGRIFSRNQLMQNMYNDHRIVSDRTIDSHIKKIRKKLIESEIEADCIHSVYGAGYRFELPEA